MRKYVKPEIEITEFSVENVITVSGVEDLHIVGDETQYNGGIIDSIWGNDWN